MVMNVHVAPRAERCISTILQMIHCDVYLFYLPVLSNATQMYASDMKSIKIAYGWMCSLPCSARHTSLPLMVCVASRKQKQKRPKEHKTRRKTKSSPRRSWNI